MSLLQRPITNLQEDKNPPILPKSNSVKKLDTQKQHNESVQISAPIKARFTNQNQM